jgi:hypothetical protein
MGDHMHTYLLLGGTGAILIYKSIEAHRSYKFQIETILGKPSIEQGLNIATGLLGLSGLIVGFGYFFQTK